MSRLLPFGRTGGTAPDPTGAAEAPPAPPTPISAGVAPQGLPEAGQRRIQRQAPGLELGTVELFVSPFQSFVEVGQFQGLLAELPSVGLVQPRRLQNGVLQVRLQCRGMADLVADLTSACERPIEVVGREPHRLEIVFGEQPAVAEADTTATTERGA